MSVGYTHQVVGGHVRLGMTTMNEENVNVLKKDRCNKNRCGRGFSYFDFTFKIRSGTRLTYVLIAPFHAGSYRIYFGISIFLLM